MSDFSKEKIDINILKKSIFPPVDNIEKLKIDDDSLIYITSFKVAEKITNLIKNNLDFFPFKDGKLWKKMTPYQRMKLLTITDLTSGVGGNILNFAKYFHWVNAIEMDPIRCEYLENNVKIYHYENVYYFCGDATKLIFDKKMKQDIIFFDPPWGGRNYKLQENLRLCLGDITIEDLCLKLLENKHNKMIVIKLPKNYDWKHLHDSIGEIKTVKYDLLKMSILIIFNYKIL